MSPEGGSVLQKVAGLQKQPSRNYKMQISEKRISGICDGIEAMKQVIYKILHTQRYQYAAYSWNYGIELWDLFGMPVSYVCPELERRIKEALLQDDRVTAVQDFSFDISVPRKVHAAFLVVTDSGTVEAETEVEI